MSLELPFGVAPVNPVPVDAHSGPYTGVDLSAAVASANSSIASGVRFQSMEVRIIVSGLPYKYWYNSGTTDADLIPFSVNDNTSYINTVSGNLQTQITENANDIDTVSGLIVTHSADSGIELVGSTFIMGGTGSLDKLSITSIDSNEVSLTIKGAAAQAEKLQEWQDSSANVVAYIDKDGNALFSGLTALGDLEVSGTLTYIHSTNVTIADKQLELASNSGSAISGDAYIDQGGIVLKSTNGDKEWIWRDSTDAWTTNDNIDVGSNSVIFDGISQTVAYTGQEQAVSGYVNTVSGNLQSQITSNDSDITALQTATGVLRTDIDSNDTDIAALQTATGNLDTRVTQNANDIDTVSGVAYKTFVVTNNGSSDYVFDGMGLNSANDPTIYLHKGHTYYFDKQIASHPFRISATDGGSVYQDADGNNIEIAGQGILRFEVPQDAPDKLYYYCTSHPSSMKGEIYTTVSIDDITNASGYLQTQITSNDTDITALQTATGNLDTRVTQNNTDINTVSGIAQGAADDVVIVSGLLPTGTASGIAFFGDDNLLTENSGLYYNSGTNDLVLYDHNNSRVGLKLHDAGWLTTESAYYRFYVGAISALQLQNDTAYWFNSKLAMYGGSTTAIIDGLAGYLDLRSANDIVRIRDTSDTAQEFQIFHSGDETNYERLSIKATGYNYEISPQVNGGTAGSVVITNDTSSKEILVVKGAASQSANLQEWQNSAGTVLAGISSNGAITTQNQLTLNNNGTINVTNANTTFNSAGNFDLLIDSNNNTTDYFRVSKHSRTAANILLNVDDDGNVSGAAKGIFTSGIQFGDSTTQTTAYNNWVVSDGSNSGSISALNTLTFAESGQTSIAFDSGTNTLTIGSTGAGGGGGTNWNLSVTGDSTNIGDGETVTFTGQGGVTLTRSSNSVIISGGGTTYTAGSGLVLDGNEFNVYGGSGNFQYVELKSSSQDPQLYFLGSGSNDTPITLNVLSSYQSASSSGSALVFDGTEGQLFAITDNLSSGVIFSVSDIAGLPLIEADASGDVQLIEFGRYVGVGTGTPEYQLDVFGTGRFSEGIIFPDGNRQTIAYTGGGGGGGSSPTGTASGVAFFGDDNLLTDDSNFYWNTGSQVLRLSAGSPPDGTSLVFGDNYAISKGNVRLMFNAGSSNSAVAILNDSGKGRLSLGADGYLSWTNSAGTPHSSAGLTLYRDVADTLAQRRGSQAQEYRIYHSGDTSNYERLSIKATGYNYEISPQVNGGTAGSVVITNDTSSKEILVVKGAASQSANLQEWQDSAGTVLAEVDNTGNISGNDIVAANDLTAADTFRLTKSNGIHYIQNGTKMRASGSSAQWIRWGTDGKMEVQSAYYNSPQTWAGNGFQILGNGTVTNQFYSNGGLRILDIGNEHYQMQLGLQFTSGTMSHLSNPNAIIRTSGTNTLFMYAEDGVKIMNLGDVGVSNSGYTGIGTEYRDLTARTGIFTSGIQFGDGTVQTTAAGGGGGGTPGGSNTNIQFNNAGSFSGESNFTWDYNTDALTVSGSTLISNTGTVFEVTNTGGTTLFAVEDSDEVQVIVAAQVGQSGNPFEVRDEFDTTVASIDVSGNISGNNIIFGDGSVQTTAPGTGGGSMNSWNLSVTGDSTNITNGETVVFSGQDAITTTRSGNTVIISGAAGGGGGGSTTGTASGVAFFGGDNNLTESTSFTFDSGNKILNVFGTGTEYGTLKLGQNARWVSRNGTAISYQSSATNFPVLFNSYSSVILAGNTDFGWSANSSDPFGATTDTIMSRDAAGEVGFYKSGGSTYGTINVGNMVIDNPTSSNVNLVVKGAASQSANLQEWQDSAGNTYSRVTNSGYFSNPVNTQSEAFGDCDQVEVGTNTIVIGTSGSTTNNPLGGCVVIGANFSTVGNATSSVLIGQGVSCVNGANGNVIIGNSAGADAGSADGTVGIGSSVSTLGNQAVAIGGSATASTYSVAIGSAASASSGEIIIKGNQATGIYVDPQGSLTIRGEGIFQSGLSVNGDADITGALTATTKSFLIDHPTKEGMKLQYGSLEGPENGVYVRGTTDLSTIELPDYWVGLVDENSITVSLTPIGSFQQLYVEDKNSKQITVGGVWGSYDYVVYAERKDVDKLEVEW